MARSATDATRFTATGPYASSKSATFKQPPRGSRFGPAPAGETPQQKVARLREAARLQREQVPPLEKIIGIGRRYADTAHRTFVLGTVTLSAIGIIYTAFAGAEMMVYNRRKRSEWAAEQEMVKAKIMLEAQQAARQGTANQEQIMLLAKDREDREKVEEKTRKKTERKSVLQRARELLFYGMAEEDQARTKAERGVVTDAVMKAREEQPDGEQRMGILQAVEETKGEGEPGGAFLPRPQGGTLDQMGQEAADVASRKTKSWSDWITRR